VGNAGQRNDSRRISEFPSLGPLRHEVFRALWIATIVSNLGTWMQDVGESWLMVSLTKSPILVALVETAGSLPVVLLALPAGAFADLIDRRRLLLVTQLWMLVAAALTAAFTFGGIMTPWLLLLMTFTLGLGSAMNSPAWQAIVPELVPRSELPAAMTLSSVAFNVSRAVGPAIGGFLVAAAGSGAVFLLNATSFLGVIVVIYRWDRVGEKFSTPTEHVWGAMRAGIRYVRNAPEVKAVLIRTGVFIFCASALWALLPLQARLRLGLGSLGYGVLLGCLGTGAVLGAGLLSRVRTIISNNLLVIGASVLFAGSALVLAHSRTVLLTGLAMLLGGVAWIACMSSFNTSAQAVAPAWARGRVLALFTLVLLGGLAVGSAAWGALASRFSVSTALDLASLGLLVGLTVSIRYRLIQSEDLNLTPWVHWPEPVTAVRPKPERGPVLVTVRYRIDPNRSQEFRHAMREMKRVRRRDGAFRWGLYSDAADPGRFVETYLVESWAEHLRQHTRITEADRKIEERAFAFHLDDGRPQAAHLVAESVK
jgi:MFS family permease/quinol monooxygenase YgiN